jgi:hypothetical protein
MGHVKNRSDTLQIYRPLICGKNPNYILYFLMIAFGPRQKEMETREIVDKTFWRFLYGGCNT